MREGSIWDDFFVKLSFVPPGLKMMFDVVKKGTYLINTVMDIIPKHIYGYSNGSRRFIEYESWTLNEKAN